MEQGERIQYICGHWLIAGQSGIQDDSVKDVPTRNCGECRRRLQDAAPQLLEALEILVHERDGLRKDDPVWVLDPSFDIAQDAIDLATVHRDPVQ